MWPPGGRARARPRTRAAEDPGPRPARARERRSRAAAEPPPPHEEARTGRPQPRLRALPPTRSGRAASTSHRTAPGGCPEPDGRPARPPRPETPTEPGRRPPACQRPTAPHAARARRRTSGGPRPPDPPDRQPDRTRRPDVVLPARPADGGPPDPARLPPPRNPGAGQWHSDTFFWHSNTNPPCFGRWPEAGGLVR